jgi:Nodulation protein S (NodS)
LCTPGLPLSVRLALRSSSPSSSRALVAHDRGAVCRDRGTLYTRLIVTRLVVIPLFVSVLGVVLQMAALAASILTIQTEAQVRAVRWADLPEVVQKVLGRTGVDRTSFDAWREQVRATNVARLRDGDFDHLVHYALQSTRFTTAPRIEPALSAKALIESLPAEERASVLADRSVLIPDSRVPQDARARLAALAGALTGPSHDARLSHFREVVGEAGRNRQALDALLLREYQRAMRFLYEKEFVAGRAADSASAVASLYQSRGHSSDTEIEAGYAVYVALASLKQLEPDRKIGRALIVGPGLDLAPRMGLQEEADPQSYQPFAVADALLALGFATRGAMERRSIQPGVGERDATDRSIAGDASNGHRALRVDAADLNPNVTRAIQRAVRAPGLRLFVASGIAESDSTRMTDDYRAYLRSFGRAIGSEQPWPGTEALSETPAGPPVGARDRGSPLGRDGHVRKAIAVAAEVQAMLSAHRLDIVTERLDTRYDLVIVTNVFPYLADAELMIALANIAAVLAPDGVLIHNEPRPLVVSTTTAMGLAPIQARTLLLATVPGGRDLYDTVWLHKKTTAGLGPSPVRTKSPEVMKGAAGHP